MHTDADFLCSLLQLRQFETTQHSLHTCGVSIGTRVQCPCVARRRVRGCETCPQAQIGVWRDLALQYQLHHVFQAIIRIVCCLERKLVNPRITLPVGRRAHRQPGTRDKGHELVGSNQHRSLGRAQRGSNNMTYDILPRTARFFRVDIFRP